MRHSQILDWYFPIERKVRVIWKNQERTFDHSKCRVVISPWKGHMLFHNGGNFNHKPLRTVNTYRPPWLGRICTIFDVNTERSGIPGRWNDLWLAESCSSADGNTLVSSAAFVGWLQIGKESAHRLSTVVSLGKTYVRLQVWFIAEIIRALQGTTLPDILIYCQGWYDKVVMTYGLGKDAILLTNTAGAAKVGTLHFL